MLHIINKSPLERNCLDTCLAVAKDGGAVLLIEDAVYAATTGHPAAVKLDGAKGRLTFYVLQPDLDARGMGDRLLAGVTPIDFGGFVDLAAEHTCQSWL